MTLTAAQAADVPTAKKALELANAKFQSGSQNQVIRMEGAETDSDLRPRQWDVTFYDSNRANNGTVIRVKDGVVISIGGAMRIVDDARWSRFFRNFSGYDAAEVFNLARWKLDSTDALAKVAALPGMNNVQITDAKMVLKKLSDGDVPPIWQVRVKARSRSKPSLEAWVGGAELSAETGEILKNEIHLARLTK